MKRARFVMALIVTVASASSLDIAPDRRVILQTGKWTPSQAQTDAAVRCAQRFLAQPIRKEKDQLGEIKHIREHAREYRVQFVGQYRKGRKVILCNFFPIQLPEEKKDGFYYWRKELVQVMDGGFWFWCIVYDPQSDTCSDFSSNGYA